MRVSDFVSSSFDRFDQQYNTACNNTNHISSSSGGGGGARGGTSTTLPSTNTNNANHNNTEGMEMPQQSFFQSMLIDLLRNTHNDNGATSLPVLFFALCRVIIALISLLLSIVGIVLHVLLAITIRILFVVVDAVGLVQRAMWRLVERAVMIVAIRIDYNNSHHHHNIDRDRRYHSNNGSSNNNNSSSSTDTYSSSTHSSADGERKRGGGGGGIIGKIWEAYGKQMLHQLSLITNTRTKLGRLPDIMNNTPPSLSLFALVTAVAFIVHPDGLTWIVLGKLCEGVWMGLQLLRDATATIVAAALSAASSSSSLSSSSQQQGGGSGGINSSGGEALPTLVASAVLASLVLLGVVIYKALYKKNMFWGTGSKTGADGQSFTTSGTSTSSSNSKKKKGRRGRNSGRHGNHHHNRGAGQRNNKKDATVVDSTTEASSADSSSLDNIPVKQPSRSRSLSPSTTTSRSNSLSSFGKETKAIDIPKPNGKANGNEAPIEGSKEKKNFKKESVSVIDSNSNNNSKSSAAQKLPPGILSKLRPDSTDSLSVPQLLDEDVSLESSVAGSSVVDCGAKQGGGPSGGGGGGGNGVSNSNITSKKRGETRGKHHGGTVSGHGMVRAPPGFVTKESAASKTSTSSRITTSASSSHGAKHLSSSEKHDGGRNNRQKRISPKRKLRDSNQNHNRGTRTRASTTDCVIRQADLQNDSNYSSPRPGSSNGNSTIGVVSSPTPSILSSGQPLLQHEQRVNFASANESSTPYLLGNQVTQDSSLLNNSMMRNNLNSPISPPVVRPPPGLGFGGVKMNSLDHSGVGSGLVAHSNNAIHGPTLSPPARLQPQRQHYSSYDQSNNFLLQPSVFPSVSNNEHKMKETTTNEDDKIDADLQELGDQMVGSVLDF